MLPLTFFLIVSDNEFEGNISVNIIVIDKKIENSRLDRVCSGIMVFLFLLLFYKVFILFLERMSVLLC